MYYFKLMKTRKTLSLLFLTVLLMMFSVFDVSSQIVINEISVKPNPNAIDPCIQSLKDCSSSTSSSSSTLGASFGFESRIEIVSLFSLLTEVNFDCSFKV